MSVHSCLHLINAWMHVVCVLLQFSSCLDASTCLRMCFELDSHLRYFAGVRQRQGLMAAAGAAEVEVVLEETLATATASLVINASLERQALAVGAGASHNIRGKAIGTIQTSDA